MKFYIAFLVSFLSGCIAFGQFNIKVGYIGGYTSLDKTESLFANFNSENPNATKPLGNIRFLHGLEVGARYKFLDNLALDIGLSTQSGDKTASGLLSSTGSLIENDWKISMTNYYIGLESIYGSYGFGANFGYQKLKYKSALNGSSDLSDVSTENQLNSRIFLILEVPSRNIAFSLRPYISFNLSPYNIEAVDNALFPNSGGSISDFEQDVMVYGLSLIFYNGPQD